jgi:hypothetical protein
MESLINNELERMCKKATVAYFEVLSWPLPEGNEENHGKRVTSLGAEI